MLLDADFVTSLAGPFGAQTLAFVKKVVKGIHYVDVGISGGTITCQVMTGDGVARTAIVDISIRTITTEAVAPAPQVVGLITTVTGTPMIGDGSQALWIRTLSDGTFSVSISGPGEVLVEILLSLGVPTLVGLSL